MDEQLRLRVQELLGLDVDSVVRIDHGWDSVAYDINGSWIVRVPRRAEVRTALRQEAELLPRLCTGATGAGPRGRRLRER